jgi:hypothetical protein
MPVANKSKAKGTRAEAAACVVLRKYTGWNWERIPLSGALDAKHGLKGDIYIPKELMKYSVEIKHYKDDHLTSKMLTGKTPQIQEWWNQTLREQEENEVENPLLIFKFDRSKWFCAFLEEPVNDYRHFYYSEGYYLALLEDYLTDRTKEDWVWQRVSRK